MPTVATNGIETYYEREGDGRPVVLLHGATADHRNWDHQTDALVDEYEVIRYDARGHGRTEGSDHDQYRIDLLADDLQALVDALDLANPCICGLSLGGLTALTYASKYPNGLSALAVAGTVTPEPQSLTERLAYGVMTRAIATGLRYVGYDRIRAAEQWISERVTEDTDDIQDQSETSDRDPIEPDSEEYAKIYSALPTYQQSSLPLENIDVPTLVIYGENEPFIESHVPVYRRRISNVSVREIPEAGHNCHLQNPEAFTATLEEFLANQMLVE